MVPEADFATLDDNRLFTNCPVIGQNGPFMQLKVPKQVDIGKPIKIEAEDTLSLGDVCACQSEGDVFVVSVELTESLHHVAALSRLAQALLG